MKRRNIYRITLVLIISVMAILVFKKDNKKSIVELNASVIYDESKSVITNIDTIDFVHADIAIDSYYKLRNYNLKAGETYTIWKVEFKHHNGTHFPNNRRPLQFSIWCELNDGINGYYSKEIK